MIDLIGIPPQAHAFVCIGIVLLMFVMFLTERYPTEVVAIGGACLMLVSGRLPFDEAVGVLSNSAPWTIALMFVLMGALVRTGALNVMTQMAERYAKSHPRAALVGVMGFVLAS